MSADYRAGDLIDHEPQNVRPGIWVSMRRALAGRCPNCGHGKLFASYLKQVDRCVSCGEPWGHIRSDDAAPWLTILIVGHIVVPIVLAVEMYGSLPEWMAMLIWPAFAALLALAVLPRAKAVLMAIIWATRAPGSELEPDAAATAPSRPAA